MNSDTSRTLLQIPLVRENYGHSILASIGIHVLAILLVIFGGYLIPRETIQLSSGVGGGIGGDISTVGVVDELSGGAGMVKPSIVPKPPALLEEPPQADQSKAIPIPQTIEPKKKKPEPKQSAKSQKTVPQNNVIPTAPEPGSGGVGGRGGGSGGGFGGGIGVSIGSGTGAGGFGDHWYARVVEGRISGNWMKPPPGVRVEIIYSFSIAPDGSIRDITQEKSSGNAALDMSAERAIRASNPLSAPPQELRGRLIKFMAHFVYPPNP